MALNNRDSIGTEDEEDRLSLLTDDTLLSILGRVDLPTAARTSVLSTRWKHLPWLLPELTIDVKDFLPSPHPRPMEVEHMDKAMSSLSNAIRSFLVAERAVTRLQLRVYLVSEHSLVVGPLVSEAIDIGTVKDLDLAIVDEKEPEDCYDEEMLQQACLVDGFFSAYPSVLRCLTSLSLCNICFARWDMHHLLFDCCNQLQHLTLVNCDAGGLSAWNIDAPNSKLRFLKLEFCCLLRLDVLFLPKLERLHWDTWVCRDAPLSLNSAPSLEELYLSCGAPINNRGFKLSELLSGNTAINDLTIDFQGERPWVQPEGEQLCTAFNKLRRLSIFNIYVEFDLIWMTVLLEAAPSVEIFDFGIWNHSCDMDEERRRRSFGERTNPSWKTFEFRSRKQWPLKELDVTGFNPVEKQITFIRSVMGRSPNLKTITLRDYMPCKDCEEMGKLPYSGFPMNEDEQDMVVNQINGDMPDSHVRIIFSGCCTDN